MSGHRRKRGPSAFRGWRIDFCPDFKHGDPEPSRDNMLQWMAWKSQQQSYRDILQGFMAKYGRKALNMKQCRRLYRAWKHRNYYIPNWP